LLKADSFESGLTLFLIKALIDILIIDISIDILDKIRYQQYKEKAGP
jgi:hypothetical protein